MEPQDVVECPRYDVEKLVGFMDNIAMSVRQWILANDIDSIRVCMSVYFDIRLHMLSIFILETFGSVVEIACGITDVPYFGCCLLLRFHSL
jgi:hypothetical protein